jgi:hypothetical protein
MSTVDALNSGAAIPKVPPGLGSAFGVGERPLEQPEEAQDHNGRCREYQDGHGAHRGTRDASRELPAET